MQGQLCITCGDVKKLKDVVAMVTPEALTAQPADGADAVHLHPETSSASHHGGPAPPSYLGLSLQEVEEELWDHPRPASRSFHCTVTCYQTPEGRRVGGTGGSS